MNGALVSKIHLPDDNVLIDSTTYKGSAQDLVTGVPDKAEVEFVLDNLGEAVAAAHQDFCCNGNDRNYFVIDLGTDNSYEMTFDLSSLEHLFGIFGDIWKKTDLYSELIKNHPMLENSLRKYNMTWLDKIEKILSPQYRNEIISHECTDTNRLIEKLNWQKMMIKIFCFLNLGKLEEGKAFFYKELYKDKYDEPSFLLVRSLRNGELEDVSRKDDRYYDKQLIIKLVLEKYGNNICLTPQALFIVDKPLMFNGERQKTKKINLYSNFGIGSKNSNFNKDYIFARDVKIWRKEDGRYAQKGIR